jgi:hypothetical protein
MLKIPVTRAKRQRHLTCHYQLIGVRGIYTWNTLNKETLH